MPNDASLALEEVCELLAHVELSTAAADEGIRGIDLGEGEGEAAATRELGLTEPTDSPFRIRRFSLIQSPEVVVTGGSEGSPLRRRTESTNSVAELGEIVYCPQAADKAEHSLVWEKKSNGAGSAGVGRLNGDGDNNEDSNGYGSDSNNNSNSNSNSTSNYSNSNNNSSSSHFILLRRSRSLGHIFSDAFKSNRQTNETETRSEEENVPEESEGRVEALEIEVFPASSIEEDTESLAPVERPQTSPPAMQLQMGSLSTQLPTRASTPGSYKARMSGVIGKVQRSLHYIFGCARRMGPPTSEMSSEVGSFREIVMRPRKGNAKEKERGNGKEKGEGREREMGNGKEKGSTSSPGTPFRKHSTDNVPMRSIQASSDASQFITKIDSAQQVPNLRQLDMPLPQSHQHNNLHTHTHSHSHTHTLTHTHTHAHQHPNHHAPPHFFDVTGPKAPLLKPVDLEDCGKKCLVLDLDETLVHSTFHVPGVHDLVVPLSLPDGSVQNIYVAKRPGVDRFLNMVCELFEVVIFTASLSRYADPVIDFLIESMQLYSLFAGGSSSTSSIGGNGSNGSVNSSPKRLNDLPTIKHRLYRESCMYLQGLYVKDLSKLGRELGQTVIIDNSPASFLLQPDHGMPIKSWFSDADDRELEGLLDSLNLLACSESVSTWRALLGDHV
jgi:hypothetical protein